MHSDIVIRHELLCDAHTVPVQHKGTVQLLYFCFTSFYVFVTLVFLFLGARTQTKEDISFNLVIPRQDICLYTHPWLYAYVTLY